MQCKHTCIVPEALRKEKVTLNAEVEYEQESLSIFFPDIHYKLSEIGH